MDLTDDEREYIISLIERDVRRPWSEPSQELLTKLDIPSDHVIYKALKRRKRIQKQEQERLLARQALPVNQPDPVSAIAQSIESLRETWNKS